MRYLILVAFVFLTGCSELNGDIGGNGLMAPFMSGEEWWLSQGSNDHGGAWDFNWGSGWDDNQRPILASCTGEIRSAGNDSGWGNTVLIQCSSYGGGFRTAHHEQIFVTEGQPVVQGQVIGTCGNTGNSSGPHVHAQWQNSPDHDADAASFSDIGNPQSGASVTSANDYIFERAQQNGYYSFNPYSGHSNSHLPGNAFGSPNGYGIHFYHDWNRHNLYTQYDNAKNCYVMNYQGGSFDGAIVYDALGGARRAYIVGWDQWLGWHELPPENDAHWNPGEGGPNSWLGMPITNSYWSTNNQWCQNFQRGYMCQQTANPYPPGSVAPGQKWDGTWDSQWSYAFAEAYERNGAYPKIGKTDPVHAAVHDWDGVWIQDFVDGAYEDSAIIYNFDTNEAFLVRGGFWEYYLTQGGPSRFGYPLGDEQDTTLGHLPYDPYCQSRGYATAAECVYEYCGADHSSMQRFSKATMCWKHGGGVEAGGGGVVVIEDEPPVEPTPCTAGATVEALMEPNADWVIQLWHNGQDYYSEPGDYLCVYDDLAPGVVLDFNVYSNTYGWLSMTDGQSASGIGFGVLNINGQNMLNQAEVVTDNYGTNLECYPPEEEEEEPEYPEPTACENDATVAALMNPYDDWVIQLWHNGHDYYSEPGDYLCVYDQLTPGVALDFNAYSATQGWLPMSDGQSALGVGFGVLEVNSTNRLNSAVVVTDNYGTNVECYP